MKMGRIGCPETSVSIYHYKLRNIQEERRSHLLSGGSLRSNRVAMHTVHPSQPLFIQTNPHAQANYLCSTLYSLIRSAPKSENFQVRSRTPPSTSFAIDYTQIAYNYLYIYIYIYLFIYSSR